MIFVKTDSLVCCLGLIADVVGETDLIREFLYEKETCIGGKVTTVEIYSKRQNVVYFAPAARCESSNDSLCCRVHPPEGSIVKVRKILTFTIVFRLKKVSV